MASTADCKDTDQGQQLKIGGKSGSIRSTKAAELECIRQNLAKRSLDAKFDLQGSDYKPIENIGIGAYGVVCSAVHNKSGDRVAIKKIPSVFEALSIAKRTYREIKILKHFKHDNIISIREILVPQQNVKDFKDIYVVFDLMESDLHRIIYSKQELSEEHIRYFLYQILRGLKYIHSANVIHRDLKPSNVLVNEDCHLRIGDFGMARGVFYTPNEPSYYMTQYVATRWYRAPEILLSMLEYGAALDMWSVGCIFAEMMGRKHLFPGKDYISQVKLIVGVLGSPSETVLKNCHHDILKKMIKSFGKREPIAWEKLFPKASKKSVDLVSKMLVINPADRISVDQALSHRLLNNYHDPNDEPICVPTFNFDFEKQDMDKTCLRSAIMDEIMSFHQPKQPTFSFNAFLRPAPKSETGTAGVEGEKVDTAQEVALLSTQLTTNMGFSGKENSQEMSSTTSASPGGKPLSKVSPVSVETNKLQLVADIEMLSAQSADGRAMDTQHTDLLTVSKEVRQEETSVLDENRAVGDKDLVISADRRGVNTINENTRALMKQALMNAAQIKQRAESQGDDSKDAKPITAAQRQREREERRRKKKERALEKVKKSKEKKRVQEPPAVALSSQDVELLRRWTVMQNPGQGDQVSQSPPHPGPAMSPPQVTTNTKSSTSSGSSQGCPVSTQQTAGSGHVSFTGSKPRQILAKTTVAPASSTTVTLGSSGQMSSAGTGLFSSSQLSLSQSHFIPVIAIPSSVNPGQLEIKRIFQHTNLTAQMPVTSGSSSLQASENTKSVLHSTILMRNSSTSQIDTPALGRENIVQKSTASEVGHTENISPVLSTCVSFSNIHTNIVSNETARQTGSVTCNQYQASLLADTHLLKPETSSDEKLSPQSQGTDLLDFLNEHLKNSPREKSNPGAVSEASSQSLYLDENQSLEDQHLFLLAGPQLESGQQHSLTPPPPYSNYSQEQLARSNSTPSLLRQASHSPNLGLQQPDMRQRPSVPVSVYREEQYPNFSVQAEFVPEFQPAQGNQLETYSQPPTDYQSSFAALNSYADFSQTAPVISFDSHPDMLYQNPSEFSLQMQQQQLSHQVFENAESYDGFNNFPSSGMTRPPPYHQSFPEFSQPPCEQQNFSSSQTFQGNSFHESTANHTHMMAQHTSGSTANHTHMMAHHTSGSTANHTHMMAQHTSGSTANHTHMMAQHTSGSTANHTHMMAQHTSGSTANHTHMMAQHTSGSSLHAESASSATSFTSSLLQQENSTAMSSHFEPGTSHPGHRLRVNCSGLPRLTDSNTELIALLTKQLSRQQIMGIVPSLALTPRGTGAGYGVGIDLDAMLTDAQDNAGVQAEQSPLSSSLLADWLEFSEHFSQADLEACVQELAFQSPMHVSYDANM